MKYKVIDENGEIHKENLTMKQAVRLLKNAQDVEGSSWDIEEDHKSTGEQKLIIWSAIAGVIAGLCGV